MNVTKLMGIAQKKVNVYGKIYTVAEMLEAMSEEEINQLIQETAQRLLQAGKIAGPEQNTQNTEPS